MRLIYRSPWKKPIRQDPSLIDPWKMYHILFGRLLGCFQSVVFKNKAYYIFCFSFNKFPYNMGLNAQLPGPIIKLSILLSFSYCLFALMSRYLSEILNDRVCIQTLLILKICVDFTLAFGFLVFNDLSGTRSTINNTLFFPLALLRNTLIEAQKSISSILIRK